MRPLAHAGGCVDRRKWLSSTATSPRAHANHLPTSEYKSEAVEDVCSSPTPHRPRWLLATEIQAQTQPSRLAVSSPHSLSVEPAYVAGIG